MEDATLVQPVSTRFVLRSIRDGHEYPLTDQLLVGREADCSLTLPEQHISRYHAKLTVTPNGLCVEDLNSSNGTFINGVRINGQQRLNIGDEIAFHETRFRVATSQSGDAEATIIETPTGRQRIVPPTPAMTGVTATPTVAALTAPASPANAQEEPGEGTRLLSPNELDKLAERNKSQSRKDVMDTGCGPRLVIMTAPLRGKVIPLNAAPTEGHWRIGRSAHADIQLEDRTVSLNHARLAKTAGGWLLSSTHARNGLHVNGTPTQRTFVKHNDRIRFGRLEVCLKLEATTPHEALPIDEPTPLWQHPYRVAGITAGLLALIVTVVILAAQF